MMSMYRFQLECRSSLGSPLAADTLWGHIAWGIRYDQGEEALIRWLDAYQDEPPLVLSDLFPADTLPRPILPPPPYSKVVDRNTLRRQKTMGQRRWISKESWSDLSTQLSPQIIQDAAIEDPCESVESGVLHAAINRLSGGTAQEGGGTLHSDTRTFYAIPPKFDLYVYSPSPIETVEKWLKAALIAGYGRDASSGLGNIHIVTKAAITFPTPSNANALYLLAGASPKRNEPMHGFARIETRAGRLGGHFATCPTPDGQMSPQKKPITRLACGSVLLSEEPLPYIGQLLKGVHSYEPIRHYAMALALPCRLSKQTIKDAVK